MSVQINFVNQDTPADKTEKTVAGIFRAAGQIMFNYHMLALKKDIRMIKASYAVILARK